MTPGYINNPEANAESFFDGSWFRTGDLGFVQMPQKVSEDDKSAWSRPVALVAGPWLTLTGRKKELINRGGEKVSPAEVEAVVAAFKDVQEAVCFPMPDTTYGEQVAIAVIPAGDAPAGQQLAYAILAACRNSLAAYQIPSTIFVLNTDVVLPRTSVGKMQRLAVLAKLTESGIKPTLEASLVG